MQGLHSLFPRGRAGVGLALLRVCVSAGLLLSMLVPSVVTLAWPWWGIAAVIALLLALGLLTTFSSCVAMALAMPWEWPWNGLTLVMLLTPLTALALALLGPGAYSLDARLFGRRELILPRKTAGKGP